MGLVTRRVDRHSDITVARTMYKRGSQVLIGLLIVACSTLYSGCHIDSGRHKTESLGIARRIALNPNDPPWVLICRPGRRANDIRGACTPLLAAVWSDGTVVRSKHAWSGTEYVAGKLGGAAIASLRKVIEARPSLVTNADIPFDAAPWVLCIRKDKSFVSISEVYPSSAASAFIRDSVIAPIAAQSLEAAIQDVSDAEVIGGIPIEWFVK